MQTDFDDLRFTQSNGTTLIDAWLELKIDSTQAGVWVEFPTTPANGITEDYYMYYGNSGALNNWDIGNTFLFGDDFPGTTLNTTKWSTVTQGTGAGSINVNNDKLTITPTVPTSHVPPNCYGVRGNTNFGYNIIVETLAKKIDGQYINTIGLTENPYFFRPHGYSSQSGVAIYARSSDSYCSMSNGTTGSYQLNSGNPNTYYRYKIERISSSSIKVYRNDILMWSPTTNIPTTNLCPSLTGDRATAGCKCEYDWIFVRKYVLNPSTYGFGSEESAPSGNPYWYYNLLKRRN